ncbi:hypothetical protein Pan54_12860 [Rubinisphaera italica]|uniref:Endonuclease/exonuclease/phosphatase domain-containing protein n=2 Tax=Rubinisphaera italica TaxID=2527969 RepID=A0A5C5XFB9_9PLAN|nr:hypothetical protein Pan54_12860 [Rubinisphaera italica]
MLTTIRHWTLVIPLLFLMSFQSANAQADEPLVLRVLCYNIHYGQGMDKVYDIPRLAKVIEKAKPDLVALQEVDVGVRRSGQLHEARQLADLTGLKVRFGPTQHYEGGLFGNAILSRFNYEDVHIQPLPYTESTPEQTTYPRAAISVIVRLPNKMPVRFISTHFQHNVPEDRVAEAKAINQFFDDRSIPTILAGDMNAKPDEEPIQILQQEWMNAIDEQKQPSAPSQNPRSRIDYIFYRGSSLKMISSEVIDESIASDHRPVLVVFEISK